MILIISDTDGWLDIPQATRQLIEEDEKQSTATDHNLNGKHQPTNPGDTKLHSLRLIRGLATGLSEQKLYTHSR